MPQIRSVCVYCGSSGAVDERYRTAAEEIGRSLAILERIQPASGGFLEAVPLTSFVTMSLAGMGLADHMVARRGIEFHDEPVLASRPCVGCPEDGDDYVPDVVRPDHLQLTHRRVASHQQPRARKKHPQHVEELRLLAVREVQSGLQASRQLHRIVVGPEMHVEQAGAVVESVIVQCRHR